MSELEELAKRCEAEFSRDEINDWLTENCGKGLPYVNAVDLPTALHGLACVLRQIESTDRYMVHIGQCGPARTAIRWVLEHLARQEMARLSPKTSQHGGHNE